MSSEFEAPADQARRDLGRIIWETSRADEQSISATGANNIASAILAAGYRKPRTITTVEELDALTVGSVVLETTGTPTQALMRQTGKNWWGDNRNALSSSTLIPLPVTVLHEGES